jgi:hypothetical protein
MAIGGAALYYIREEKEKKNLGSFEVFFQTRMLS